MPARDYLQNFQHDPTTFDFDRFKAGLLAEMGVDDDLAGANLTAITEDRDTRAANERDLKVRLFDATIGRQGDPVRPADSPASEAGGKVPDRVPETDIFEKVS